MVIFLQFEMEDDGRRNSKKVGIFKRVFSGGRPSPSDSRRKYVGGSPLLPRERRPLRSVPLAGPHYRVEPDVLVSSFVEKEAKYLGTVMSIPCDFDPSKRAALLKIIDEQRALKLMPQTLTYKDDVIVSFSVHNINLCERDGEKLIHRMQTHKIAAVGYARDDSYHLVFIKFASDLDSGMCNLVVLSCETKNAAEELCSLAQQIFQLVYTASTIDFLDKSIMDGALTPKNHSYSTDDSDKKDTATVSSREHISFGIDKGADSLSFPSTSRSTAVDANGHSGYRFNLPRKNFIDPLLDLPAGSSSTFPQSTTSQRAHRHSGSSGSSSNNNATPATCASTTTLVSPVSSTRTFPVHRELQLQDYITVLKEQLTKVELQDFAALLHQFRTGAIKIEVFCQKLLEMYTEKRKSLLLGMRHFIPNKSDLTYFNTFLKSNDVEDIGSSSWWAQPPNSNAWTFSETEESTASTSVNASHLTAVSLSSSGSEKAYGEDLIADFGTLGLSEALEFEATKKSLNGKPPEEDVSQSVLQLDPPKFREERVTETHVPQVASVPAGFGDSFNEGDGSLVEDFTSQPAKTKESPKKSYKLKPERSKNFKPLHEKKTSKEKNNIDKEESSEKRQEKVTQKIVNVKQKVTRGDSASSDNKEDSVSSDLHQKPVKEHRKKKKHKGSSTGSSEMFEAQL
uniref:HrPET-3 n=1 Tax=Halocynthia roretzi TaxID=7729 RepID=Q9Y1V6_HALRO|nr:HrPET-3 [Halocynthia roretzi]